MGEENYEMLQYYQYDENSQAQCVCIYIHYNAGIVHADSLLHCHGLLGLTTNTVNHIVRNCFAVHH